MAATAAGLPITIDFDDRKLETTLINIADMEDSRFQIVSDPNAESGVNSSDESSFDIDSGSSSGS